MTTTTEKIDPQSVENQRIVGQLVEREVGHCVSMLVSHFTQNVDALQGSDYNLDGDIYPLCECDDWQGPVLDHEGYIAGDVDIITVKNDDEEQFDCSTWQEAAECLGIDEPYRYEALEHWIVSDRAAEKLRERGEIVGELFGLTIWGRCCSGQAIHLDSVWSEIATEMEILVGQQNEWKARCWDSYQRPGGLW